MAYIIKSILDNNGKFADAKCQDGLDKSYDEVYFIADLQFKADEDPE